MTNLNTDPIMGICTYIYNMRMSMCQDKYQHQQQKVILMDLIILVLVFAVGASVGWSIPQPAFMKPFTDFIVEKLKLGRFSGKTDDAE